MPLCCKCQTVRIPPKPPSQPGFQRTVCDDCSSWRGVLKPKPTNCTQCGVELQHGNRERSQYCSVKCRQARSKEQRKAEGRPTTYSKPKPPRGGTCTICGIRFLRTGMGKTPMTCGPDCAKLKRQADLRAFHQRRVTDGREELRKAKRRKTERHPCVDCGQEVWNSNGPRCRACSRDFSRMLRRAAGHGLDLASAARVLVFDRDGRICQLCDEPVDLSLVWPDPRSATIDHVIPLSKCLEHFGPDYVDSADNWQTAHYFCNQSKGARVAF